MSEQDVQTCLCIKGLSVTEGETPILRDLSLNLTAGGSLAIVGERGAGKTALVSALAGKLRSDRWKIEGSAFFQRADLLQMKPKQLSHLLYSQLSFLPLLPIGGSLGEGWFTRATVGQILCSILCKKHKHAQRESQELATEMLELVEIPSPKRRLESFLGELPAALAERVKLAAALCCDPALLIADEPATALSPIEQAEFFSLLLRLQGRLGTALLLTTADPRVALCTCANTLILKNGVAMEQGPTCDVLSRGENPYTRQLTAPLSGRPSPILGRDPFCREFGSVTGCPFATQCPQSMPLCRGEMPPQIFLGPGHLCRCWAHKGGTFQ